MTPPPVDPRLAKFVTDIEAQEIGLRVIAARVYKLPLVVLGARVGVQSPRQFNVLEEFILQLTNDLLPPPTTVELAAMLGLDQLFVKATAQELGQLQALSVEGDGRLGLTSVGRQYYQQGQVPRPPEYHTLQLGLLGLTHELRVWKTLPPAIPDAEFLPGGRQAELETQVMQAARAITSEQVIEATRKAGLGLHVPKEGRLITEVEAAVIRQTAYSSCGVLLVQDTACPTRTDDNISLRAFNLTTNTPDFGLEQALQRWLVEQGIGLDDLLPPDSMPETLLGETPVVPTEATSLQAGLAQLVYAEHIAGMRGTQEETQTPVSQTTVNKGTVELLRDGHIRPRFLQALQSAQYTVLIISPWISEQVVDEAFKQKLRELAQRRVQIIVGWGIARSRELEERVPPETLFNELHSIMTPEGVPAVTVWWIGNQHSKDVLVDRRIHLSGSHNWLSYRGDRQPRGESTYFVTMPEPVQQAADHVEGLLTEASRQQWSAETRKEIASPAILRRCCTTWVITGRYGEAFERIAALGRDGAKADLAVELLGLVCLILAARPTETLAMADILDTLQLAASEVLKTFATAAETPGQLSEAVKAIRRLLARFADQGQGGLVSFLDEERDLWTQIGLITAGQTTSDFVRSLKGTPVSARKAKKEKKKGKRK